MIRLLWRPPRWRSGARPDWPRPITCGQPCWPTWSAMRRRSRRSSVPSVIPAPTTTGCSRICTTRRRRSWTRSGARTRPWPPSRPACAAVPTASCSRPAWSHCGASASAAASASSRAAAGRIRRPLPAHAVAAGPLGLVQEPVRALDELVDVGLLGLRGSNSDRNLDVDVRVLESELGRLHQLADLLGELHGARIVDLGQHDGELLATEARHDVLAPDLTLDHRGQVLEHIVAGQVAKGVVNGLEVIDVEHDERQITPIPMRA